LQEFDHNKIAGRKEESSPVALTMDSPSPEENSTPESNVLDPEPIPLSMPMETEEPEEDGPVNFSKPSSARVEPELMKETPKSETPPVYRNNNGHSMDTIRPQTHRRKLGGNSSGVKRKKDHSMGGIGMGMSHYGGDGRENTPPRRSLRPRVEKSYAESPDIVVEFEEESGPAKVNGNMNGYTSDDSDPGEMPPLPTIKVRTLFWGLRLFTFSVWFLIMTTTRN